MRKEPTPVPVGAVKPPAPPAPPRKAGDRVCRWQQTAMHTRTTGCGHEFEGHDVDFRNFDFCPKCAGRIELV